MIKRVYLLANIMMLALTLCACSKNKTSDFDKKIWMQSPVISEYGYFGGNHEIKFNAQLGWKISTDVSWITVIDAPTGKGHGSVKIVVLENQNFEPRQGNVMVTAEGGDTQVIEVKQRGRFALLNVSHPSLLYTGKELLEIKEIIGQNRSVSVTATYDNLISQCDRALSFETNPYIGSDPLAFHNALLQTASYSRDLAMAYWLTDKNEYAEKAIQLVKKWAVMTKDNLYEAPLYNGVGTGTGMYLGRAMYPMLVAYDMLVDKYTIEEESKEVILNWFRILYPANLESIQIWEQQDYFGKQYYQNHLVAHSLSIMALGFILEDQDMIRFALDSQDNPKDLYDLIEGAIFMDGDPAKQGDQAKPTVTGEIYDRYRHDASRGLQYTHLTQSLLATMARMLYNNGLDVFSYTAPTGENIGLTYDYYADFYRLKDACIKSGYYCGETARIGLAGDAPEAYEMGLRHYPTSQPIKALVHSGVFNREAGYFNLFGYTRFLSATVEN